MGEMYIPTVKTKQFAEWVLLFKKKKGSHFHPVKETDTTATVHKV